MAIESAFRQNSTSIVKFPVIYKMDFTISAKTFIVLQDVKETICM